MKYMKQTRVFILITIFIIFLLNSASSTNKNSIHYSELHSKYSIIGPLGVELGKVLELEVEKIKLPVKSDPPTLKVTAINGKKLKKPVLLKYHMLIITDKFDYNKIYKIKAFQDGSFTGIPHAVLKEIMIQTTDYFFEVSLVVFKYIE